MAQRTTIEAQPLILKLIKGIARRQNLTIKAVTNDLLRFAIPHETRIFSQPTQTKDNGK